MAIDERYFRDTITATFGQRLAVTEPQFDGPAFLRAVNPFLGIELPPVQPGDPTCVVDLIREVMMLQTDIRRLREQLAANDEPPVPPPGDGDLGERVDRVIGDVLGGRVPHRKVDELADATERSKRDRALGRAIRAP